MRIERADDPAKIGTVLPMKLSQKIGRVAGAIFAVALFFQAPILHAQEEAGAQRRPKIGLVLPAGRPTGRNLMANLRELTIPVRHIHDFDRLPIPFRAAATDVETGELVVLRRGDLVEAVRASMSVPAIFTPQKIDGRLMVD